MIASSFSSILFLKLPPPPTSTPFPTRRSSDLLHQSLVRNMLHVEAVKRVEPGHRQVRSEEHTSELQSQSNIVCRLLLEKKKDTEHARRLTLACLLVLKPSDDARYLNIARVVSL